ncbi:saccharopine dehydrogenase [Flavobacterium cerinum]|uniref:Saccharopine dehydrogenase n=1 Tax=Flavobacterium cerinum TaxID=2502784 RepID=A0ABY5IQF7_9FLAO|nr:saccharopine dehydrogenase [Flavobacterium cerinum]UUC44510.1 saccharopine dehydrogenase [Flavobacterium cerinum]
MQKNILIIGGTGLIGSTVYRILKERNPNYNLFIGSRKKRNSDQVLCLDVSDFATLSVIAQYSIDLIILCTNDQHNNVLHYAIANQLDYIDITKPTPDLKEAFSIAGKEKNVANKIVFSSGWMAGIVSGLLQDFKGINTVALFVYYSISDKAGESSAHFMAENVSKPFVRYKNNQPVTIKHFLDSEDYTFSFDVGKRRVYNFDVPDLFILNAIENVPNVSVKMTYSSRLVTRLLGLFQSLRLFNLLSLKNRRLIFSANGKGDKTIFEIIAKTSSETIKTTLKSDNGQSELTAFATVLHIEKILNNPFPDGVYFSHQLYQPDEMKNALLTNKTIKINTFKN